MKSPRVIGLLLVMVFTSLMLVACGGNTSSPKCFGAFDCTSTETCYANQCVTIKDAPPPPTGSCDETSCPEGCCEGDVCRAQSDLLCGRGGAACSSCAGANGQCNEARGACEPKSSSGCLTVADCQPGWQCQGGKCVDPNPPAPTCNATICPTGCCDASGKCQPTISESACGIPGGSCSVCASGQVCNKNAGICEQQSTTCNNQNCSDGCCDAVTGKCRRDASARNQFCGLQGATCTDCGSDKTCSAAGVCQGSQPVCTAATCATGCCDANGQCQPSVDATCGIKAVACSACTGGNTCQAGTCQPPTSKCDATTCPNGCCDASGKCQAGTGDAACGASGGQCQSCSANGYVCDSQKCAPKPPSCSAATCPNGCCDASGQCQVAKASACGNAGGACVVCKSGEQCTAGSCKSSTASYPPGPYGSSPGSTIEDLSLTQCGAGAIKLSAYRATHKALLLVVSSGSS